MITKVFVENFKSFDAPTELTMVSSTKIRTKMDHRIKMGSNTRLLKHAIIYGANASGKSNLIDFFRFFKTTLRIGIPIWSNRCFCRCKASNEGKDSTFEIQFSTGGKFYAYGFSARLSERWITGEWLYELYQRGTSRRIFEREGAAKPIIDDSVSLSKEDKQRFDTYAGDFSENITDLFLAEMNKGKRLSEDSNLYVFKIVYNWLQNNLIILTPNDNLTDFQYYYDDESLAMVNKLIQTFDTGISNIRIDEIDVDDLRSMLPDPIFKDIMEKVRESVDDSDTAYFRMSGRSKNSFFNIEVNGNEEPRVTTIRLRHGKSAFDFDFEDESDGTRRLFDLIDMLLIKQEDVVFVVDELERSLHPKLTVHFLELFEQLHKNHHIQLIFTTHESSIMDQELFRRDEIWFIERDNENASAIYSLDRFKERYDRKLSKAYLEGRYGAIPVFKEFRYGEEA